MALMLPDFSRPFVKHYSSSFPDFTTEEAELFAGCQAHYAADKKFHPSAFFNDYADLFNKKIKAASFSPVLERRWFIAHILVEMMIDRLIVRHYSHTCNMFYTNLRQIDTKILEHFVLRYTGDKTVEGFLKNFEHFRKAQYLFGYVQDPGFCFSVARVVKHATGQEMNWNDRWVLTRLVHEIEANDFARVQELFLNLKTLFT